MIKVVFSLTILFIFASCSDSSGDTPVPNVTVITGASGTGSDEDFDSKRNPSGVLSENLQTEASKYLTNSDKLVENNLLRESVAELSNNDLVVSDVPEAEETKEVEQLEEIELTEESPEFDLKKALTEIDLIEFELKELGCLIELDSVFEGFVVKKFKAEVNCPRNLTLKARAEVLYQINSYMFLANLIPNEILDENLRHLLIIKVNALGGESEKQVSSTLRSLERTKERYERYKLRWNDFDCIVQGNCEPTDNQLVSIRTIGNECPKHLEEVMTQSKVWPILKDFPYLEMRDFFEECSETSKTLMEKYNLNGEPIIDDDPTIVDLTLEYRCYSNVSMRVRLYCQEVRNKIKSFLIDERVAKIIRELGITEVFMDESASKKMIQVGAMLITYKKYNNPDEFLAALLGL